MLEFIRGKATDRKLRLFAVVCLRRIRHLFKHEDVLRSLEVAEPFAEGRATDEELRTAEALAMWAGDDASWHSMQEAVAAWAAAAAADGEGIAAARGAVYEVQSVHGQDEVQCDQEKLAQCHFLRDIFGNPFLRPCAIDPMWLVWGNGTVRLLVDAIYDGESFDRLPILADALEEAGCQDQDILGHCRQLGPHVRGCWVVDLLLGEK
jgi:hypothetical protein